jgi:hypothetical protein
MGNPNPAKFGPDHIYISQRCIDQQTLISHNTLIITLGVFGRREKEKR